MVEDLTDLLRAQNAAAWREVARRIAHEIKNPLTPIQLAAQRLRKKFAEGARDLGRGAPRGDRDDRARGGGAQATGRRVLAVRAHARGRAARGRSARHRPIGARALPRAGEVRWDVDVDPTLGRVRVDAEQMRRVLINLVDNAVAAVAGPRDDRDPRAADRPRAGRCGSRWRTTGPASTPRTREGVHAVFLDQVARHGLGLAIVQRIVTEHRGTIRVERNEPARGRASCIEICRRARGGVHAQRSIRSSTTSRACARCSRRS